MKHDVIICVAHCLLLFLCLYSTNEKMYLNTIIDFRTTKRKFQIIGKHRRQTTKKIEKTTKTTTTNNVNQKTNRKNICRRPKVIYLRCNVNSHWNRNFLSTEWYQRVWECVNFCRGFRAIWVHAWFVCDQWNEANDWNWDKNRSKIVSIGWVKKPLTRHIFQNEKKSIKIRFSFGPLNEIIVPASHGIVLIEECQWAIFHFRSFSVISIPFLNIRPCETGPVFDKEKRWWWWFTDQIIFL